MPVQTERGRTRLAREARAMARFVHAHVVPLLDVGEHEGHLYLVLALLEGKSRQHCLRQGGSLPLDEVLRVGGHVGEALYGAHALGLIHRDVKPANVPLDPRGNALLTDLGRVKDLGQRGQAQVKLATSKMQRRLSPRRSGSTPGTSWPTSDGAWRRGSAPSATSSRP